MHNIEVILPHMRGASVTVGSRVHALFLPNATKAVRPAGEPLPIPAEPETIKMPEPR